MADPQLLIHIPGAVSFCALYQEMGAMSCCSFVVIEIVQYKYMVVKYHKQKSELKEVPFFAVGNNKNGKRC